MYSVEIGHIYYDEELNDDYIKKIKQSIEHLKSLNLINYQLKILIDDIHIKEKKWNVNQLISLLKKNNINIDFISFESSFKFHTDFIINNLPKEKITKEYFRKEKKEVYFFNDDNTKIALKTIIEGKTEKPTCILLSTIWQLCRIGYLNFPQESLLSFNEYKKPQYSINLLDEKYKNIEYKVLKILKNFTNTNNIKNIYI